jgi:hypothetical protein
MSQKSIINETYIKQPEGQEQGGGRRHIGGGGKMHFVPLAITQ